MSCSFLGSVEVPAQGTNPPNEPVSRTDLPPGPIQTGRRCCTEKEKPNNPGPLSKKRDCSFPAALSSGASCTRPAVAARKGVPDGGLITEAQSTKPPLLPVSSFASPADCSAQHSKQGLPGTCQGRLYQIRFLKQKFKAYSLAMARRRCTFPRSWEAVLISNCLGRSV